MGSRSAVNIRTLLDEVLSEWEVHNNKLMATLTDNGSNMVAALAHLEDIARDGNGDDGDDDEEEEVEHEGSEEITDILSMEEENFLIVKKGIIMNLFITTASVVFHIHCSLLSTNLITAVFSRS